MSFHFAEDNVTSDIFAFKRGNRKKRTILGEEPIDARSSRRSPLPAKEGHSSGAEEAITPTMNPNSPLLP